MVNRLFACDPDRLQSYLDDELDAHDQAELANHLNHCGTCQRELEQLAAGSRFWDVLPQLKHVAEPLIPGAAQGHSSGRPGEKARSATGREGLEFLSASTNPSHLGRLGPYEIVDRLGEGGMGVVLKALDPALNRVVAIKVLAPQMAACGAARRRFSREAKAAAAVVHDHVIAIYAVDTEPDHGLPYLVMPYIAGQSLQERIDRDGPLRPEVVLRIGMQTALGLAAAHAQGLVHRDIKPSNILLENCLERVRITDFGLARAVDDASQSQSGFVSGTPQYMSPEQARGETVDHRADLFSLGSVLYAMCAGHSPFRAKTTMGVLRRVSDDEPRLLCEVNSEVPEELEEVIARLHSKDPSCRYQTAAEVADELGKQLADLQRPGVRLAAAKRASNSRPVSKPTKIRKKGKIDDELDTGRRSSRTRIVVGVLSLLTIVIGLAMAGTSTPLAFLAAIRPRAETAVTAIQTATPTQSGSPSRVTVTNSNENPLIVGSGKPVTKGWDLTGFSAVEIRHPFRAELKRGDRTEVSVTADDNVLEHVQVVKEGTRLKVHLEEGKDYRFRRDALKLSITLPTLELLDVSHGVRASIAGFDAKHPLEARISHGSRLDGKTAAGRLVVDATHGSEVALEGTAETALLTAGHGSRLSLQGLAVGEPEITLAHGSTATINARSDHRIKANLGHGSNLDGEIHGGDIDLKAGHGCHVSLKGSARKATIVAGHSNQLSLGGLNVETVNVQLEFGCTATVHAKNKLDYRLSHASHLKYIGNPTIGSSKKSEGSSARSIAAAEQQEASIAKPVRSRQGDDGSELITIDLSHNWSGYSSINVSDWPGAAIMEGSGKRATKSVDLKDFAAIEIDRLMAADITRADSFRVSLTADDNVLDLISAARNGSTLRITLAKGNYFLRQRPRATISLPILEGIVLGGTSHATIQGFSSDHPFRSQVGGASKLEGSIKAGDTELTVGGSSTIALSGSARGLHLLAHGASSLQLGDLSIGAGNLTIEATDASSAQLRGSAHAAVLRAQGASSLALADLTLDAADVDLSGASNAKVKVKSLLNYELTSASHLEYLGNPTIGKSHRSGGSSISHR
jgi:serine/threonine-protein kinase